MATHIRIKEADRTHIHFDSKRNNYTLCGLETGGDEGMQIKEAVIVNKKVNCPNCIWIVEFCHNIKKTEF